MAKQLQRRPSELYEIEDGVTAWSFDRAVLAFGNALESKLHQISRDTKTNKEAERKVQQEMDKWLRSGDDPNVKVKGRYRDPISSMKMAK